MYGQPEKRLRNFSLLALFFFFTFTFTFTFSQNLLAQEPAHVPQDLKEHQEEFVKLLSNSLPRDVAQQEVQLAQEAIEDFYLRDAALLQTANPSLVVASIAAKDHHPLLTFVQQVFIPLSHAQKVAWFVPRASLELYQQLLVQMQTLSYLSPVQWDKLSVHAYAKVDMDLVYSLQTQPFSILLFHGAPPAGQWLQEQLVKDHPATLFFRYDAGINPLIVTEQATAQLPQALAATLFSVGAPANKQCFHPNVFMVHAKLVLPFIGELLEKLATLEQEPQDLSSWEEFKTTNADYLLDEMAVSPQILIFPAEKFAQFAQMDLFSPEKKSPFIFLFSFNLDDELKKMLSDERLLPLGMYAYLYTDPAHSSTATWVKYLEDSHYSAGVNRDPFQHFADHRYLSGGGSGGGGSTTSVLSFWKGGEGDTRAIDFAWSLDYASEVARFFPTTTTTSARVGVGAGATTATEENEKASAFLTETLHSQLPPIDSTVERPTGIEFIRQSIREKGFLLAAWDLYDNIKKQRHLEMQNFYGAPLYLMKEQTDALTLHVPQVVMHQTFLGTEDWMKQQIQGSLNITNGPGTLSAFLHNKLHEYYFAEGIWPGIMAPSIEYGDLPLPAEFSHKKELLVQELNSLWQNKRPPSPEEMQSYQLRLTDILTDFFQTAQKKFPQGSFIKNYGESSTGDFDLQITSDQADIKKMLQQFHLCFLEALKKDLVSEKANLNSLQPNHYDTSSKFILKLLLNPDGIMIQQRLPLALTPMGYPQEVRVDFVDSESAHSLPRYSYEYTRPLEEEAKTFLNQFFRRAKSIHPLLGQLSGGADVARLDDGSFRVIEFNFGASSGSQNALIDTVYAQGFIEAITGHPTPLLQQWRQILKLSLKEQREFLFSFKQVDELFRKKGMEDVSRVDMAKWLRDQYLDDFYRAPSVAKGREVLAHLQGLLTDLADPTYREFDILLKDARDFIELTLIHLSEN